MKTGIKILLLMLAIAGAVFGVLYWQKTQVEPPKNISIEGNNLATLKAHVETLNATQQGSELDKAFDRTLDELNFMTAEGLITHEQSDEQLCAFAPAYADGYTSQALSKLGSSWTHDDLKAMAQRCKLLSNLTTTDGSKVVDDSNVTGRITTINKVNTDYGKASAIASQTRFGSVASAKQRISDAGRYRNDTYLRHCDNLVTRLQALPGKIGDSHFATVRAAVNAFVGNPQAYSDINAKKNDLYKRISEYSGMTHRYGSDKGSGELHSKVSSVSIPSYYY